MNTGNNIKHPCQRLEIVIIRKLFYLTHKKRHLGEDNMPFEDGGCKGWTGGVIRYVAVLLQNEFIN